MRNHRGIGPGIVRLLLGIAGLSALGAPVACTRQQPERAPGAAAAPSSAPSPTPELPIDVMPKLVSAPIEYPDEARRRGEEGLVQVKALVGADGRVTEAAVAPDQTVSPVLAAAAVAAVRRWTFEPARRGSEPVAVWIAVPVNFRLH